MSTPDLTKYSDSRLVDYLAFVSRSAHDYATCTQAGRSFYRRERNRVERYMDTRGPVSV